MTSKHVPVTNLSKEAQEKHEKRVRDDLDFETNAERMMITAEDLKNIDLKHITNKNLNQIF